MNSVLHVCKFLGFHVFICVMCYDSVSVYLVLWV